MKMKSVPLFLICLGVLSFWFVGYLGGRLYNEYNYRKMRENGNALWFTSGLKDADGCRADDIAWDLEYYHLQAHRQKDPIPLLHCLLDQPKLMGNHIYKRFVVHYFASVFHENEATMEELKNLREKVAEDKKEIINEIITSAKSFSSPSAESSEEINLLWGEFMATGSESSVRKIISAMDERDDQKDNGVMGYAAKSLLFNILRNYSSKEILQEASKQAGGKLKEKTEALLQAIDYLEKQARRYVRRGLNYNTLKEYDKAIREFERALKIFPGYAAAYNNMGTAYELKGDTGRAFQLVQKSVEIASNEDFIFFNMGRHYFMRREYDDAIQYYKEALRVHPEKPNYNHAIARAYQIKGDVPNAVRYFHRYLAYAPNGQFVALVKQYLRSVHAEVNENPDDVVVMLQKKEYGRLEEYLLELLKSKKKDANGHSKLYLAYEKLTDSPDTEHVPEQWLKYFQDWEQFNGSSHFANACLGMFYINYGWRARGSGWSSSVVEKGWKLYRERLYSARDYLEKAYEEDRSDPLVPARLITVSRGLGFNRGEMELQFRRAVEADETSFAPYNEKLIYLMPKWHGSEKEMFAFARETAQNAPPHSMLPRILAKAHWEMFYRSDDMLYFKDADVWKEVKNAYNRVLESFPQSNENRNWLALAAYLAGDYKTARRQFELIQGDWLEDCWGNIAYFRKVQTEVQVKRQEGRKLPIPVRDHKMNFLSEVLGIRNYCFSSAEFGQFTSIF